MKLDHAVDHLKAVVSVWNVREHQVEAGGHPRPMAWLQDDIAAIKAVIEHIEWVEAQERQR